MAGTRLENIQVNRRYRFLIFWQELGGQDLASRAVVPCVGSAAQTLRQFGLRIGEHGLTVRYFSATTNGAGCAGGTQHQREQAGRVKDLGKAQLRPV